MTVCLCWWRLRIIKRTTSENRLHPNQKKNGSKWILPFDLLIEVNCVFLYCHKLNGSLITCLIKVYFDRGNEQFKEIVNSLKTICNWGNSSYILRCHVILTYLCNSDTTCFIITSRQCVGNRAGLHQSCLQKERIEIKKYLLDWRRNIFTVYLWGGSFTKWYQSTTIVILPTEYTF